MGKALMHRAMAAMRGRDIEQVRVAFWSGNHAAQALYQSCGFREARVREHHGLPMSLYVSGVAQAVASLRPAPGSLGGTCPAGAQVSSAGGEVPFTP